MTTTSSAQDTGKQVQLSANSDITREQEVRASISYHLSNFPELAAFNNIKDYCLSEFFLESQFNQFGNTGNSRGNSIITGVAIVPDDVNLWKSGRGFYRKYWVDSVIINKRNQIGSTPAILDGLYAHGLAQVIGAYHIKVSLAA